MSLRLRRFSSKDAESYDWAMAPMVFLSHATEDKQRFVNGLDERLQAEGIGVWLDERELTSSPSMVEGIFEQGLGKSDVVVIVLTENSIRSKWVRAEMETAVILRIEDKCRVLPVLLDGVDVPVSLKTAYHVRVSDCDAYDEEFGRILEVIRGRGEGSDAGAPMGQAWLQRRVDYAIAKAGRRYTPELHTEVASERALDGVGRAKGFVEEWRKCLAVFRERRPWPLPKGAGGSGVVEQAQEDFEGALEDVDRETMATIASLEGFAEFPDLESAVEAARGSLLRLHALLRLEDAAGETLGGYQSDAWHFEAGRSLAAVEDLSRLHESTSTQAAMAQELLITGPAGTGKTHLLCEAANARTREGLPTILVLGQEFDREPLCDQIPRLTAFSGSVEEEVAALASAAEAAGRVGLLIVDALNESHQPGRWKYELDGLRHIVAQHEHVALVVSCRSEVVSEVLGETDILRLEHHGFGGATETAITRYALEYGIDPVSFPVLSPEFSNPLFLSLACKALETLGHDSFQLGEAGLSAVCDAFLEAVNERLSSADRCDFNNQRKLVQQAVRVLAEVGVDSPLIDWDKAEELLDQVLPDRTWSRSLLKGLLDEGVLIPTASGVGFGYQRLGDLAIASNLCEKTVEEIEGWIAGLGNDRRSHMGVLGALAVKLPEQKGIEIINLLADEEGIVGSEDLDLFVESLVLRSAPAISKTTILFLQRILEHEATWEDPYTYVGVCEQIVQLSCVPDHPLNAKWAHTWLMGLILAERDTQWSQFLVGWAERETPVRRLIDWARESSSDAEPEGRHLAGLMLGWMLTTSDNRVRDKATKALVALLEPDPETAGAVLASFCGLNDPHAVERLAGVACGIALRSTNPETCRQIAYGVVGLLGDQWPAHLLTRDYANRVFQVALQAGWEPPGGARPEDFPYRGPPYGAELPSPEITTEQIAQINEQADNGYSSILLSLYRNGDFEKYVLRPALNTFKDQSSEDLVELAQRAIFERVLELGWTPEGLEEIDTRLHSGSRTDHAVERVGKKYQWIALYELLGRLTDQWPIKGRMSDDPPAAYRFAEQIVYRDIDPTVLARKPSLADDRQTSFWFSPAEADFDPAEAEQCPSGTFGLPDPLELIAVQDQHHNSWLTLHTTRSWQEDFDPEQIALRQPEIHIWMHVRCYLISANDLDAMKQWAKAKDWSRQWMPEPADMHNILLASHPHHLLWEPASGDVDWWRTDQEIPPCDLTATSAMYAGTGTNRDHSAPTETQGHVPTRRLFDMLDLRRAADFIWTDSHGTTIATDPSTQEGGSAAMLISRQEALSKLEQAGYTLLWTVAAEKILIRHDHTVPHYMRWVEASATYFADEGEVALQSATASLWGNWPNRNRNAALGELFEEEGMIPLQQTGETPHSPLPWVS